VLPQRELGRGLRGLRDRPLLGERLLRGLEDVPVRPHLGREADHGACHPEPLGLELGLPERPPATEPEQVDQGLGDPDLERLAGESDFAVEDRVADGAGSDQVGAGQPQLLHGGEQVPVVRERDLDRAIHGQLALEQRLELRVVRSLDRLVRAPGDLQPLLLDPLLHLRHARVTRHRSAPGREQGDERRWYPGCSPHSSLLSTRAMPHFGQVPGALLVTSGCIGQT
jgi:hypothetical protein